MNFGLNHLNGKGGLAGWRWMFLVQGLIAIGNFLEYVMASILTVYSHWLCNLLLDCGLPGELTQELPFPYTGRAGSC